MSTPASLLGQEICYAKTTSSPCFFGFSNRRIYLCGSLIAGCGTESHGFNQSDKFKFSSQLPVGSGQKPLSHCVTAPLSWEPKNRRFKAVPEREGGIAKRNGLNLIFSKWKSGICRNFFKKVPCTFKNLFKTAHSMCLRK